MINYVKGKGDPFLSLCVLSGLLPKYLTKLKIFISKAKILKCN